MVTPQNPPKPEPGSHSSVERAQWRELFGLLGATRPEWPRFVVAILAQSAANAFVLSLPLLLGRLVDQAVSHQGRPVWGGWKGDKLTLIWILAGAMIGHGLFSFIHFNLFHQATERGLFRLRSEVFGKLICLPMSFFGRERVGELTARLSGDLAQLQELFSWLIPAVVRNSIMLLGSLALMASTSGSLTLVLFGVLPPLVILASQVGRRIRRTYRQARDELGVAQVVVEESLQNIATVKSFGNEGYELRRYQKALERFVSGVLKGIRLRAGFAAAVLVAFYAVTLGVLFLGLRKVEGGALTAGELAQFLLYTGLAAAAMGAWAEIFGSSQRILGAGHRLTSVLKEVPETRIQEPANSLTGAGFPRFQGDIEFREVTFGYPTRPEVVVLRKFSLRLQKGERVGVVGPSGAGKSTLTALLLRLYEIQQGALLVDGRPVAEWDISSLRAQIAVVPQEVLLFGGSIADNIAYGAPGAGQSEVEEAARRANAHEFISRLPQGYDTMVGERGFQLSGGQRQRIAIARAILRNPAILILDEATSALDPENERAVQAALNHLMQGRTTLIIAHRLSTVSGADRIVVMDEGQVVEEGNHPELMRRERGLYRTLWELQSHREA